MKIAIRNYDLFLDWDGDSRGIATEYEVIADGVVSSGDLQWVIDHIKDAESKGYKPVVVILIPK